MSKLLLPADPVLALVEGNMKALRQQPTKAVARSSTNSSSQQDGNRIIRFENTAALYGGTPLVINEDGYAVRMLKAGSDPFAVKLDLGKAGVYGPVYPGVEIRCQDRFDRISVTVWNSGVLPRAGALTAAGSYANNANAFALAIAKTPEARYIEPDGAGGFSFYRESVNQAYNSLLNVPTSSFDGVSLRGARAIRVCVQAGVGETITGGTIVWWYFDAAANDWAETDVQQTLPTGRRTSAPSELEVAFRGGRLFPEVRSLTDSGGSGSPYVLIEVYGEGGDLSPGDVP